jgi:hypothetical protein
VVQGGGCAGVGELRIGVEAAEVVEEDLRRVMRRTRDRAELFLHALERARRRGMGRIDVHRADAREPADGARHVERAVAAVAFDVDVDRRVDRHRQSREQNVVDARVERSCDLDDLCRGKLSLDRLRLQRALGNDRGCVGFVRELLGPDAVRRRHRIERLAAQRLQEIGDQDAPGHAVDGEMVNREQQALVVADGLDGAARFDVEVAREAIVRVERSRRCDVQCAVGLEADAQCVMRVEQRLQR